MTNKKSQVRRKSVRRKSVRRKSVRRNRKKSVRRSQINLFVGDTQEVCSFKSKKICSPKSQEICSSSHKKSVRRFGTKRSKLRKNHVNLTNVLAQNR